MKQYSVGTGITKISIWVYWYRSEHTFSRWYYYIGVLGPNFLGIFWFRSANFRSVQYFLVKKVSPILMMFF